MSDEQTTPSNTTPAPGAASQRHGLRISKEARENLIDALSNADEFDDDPDFVHVNITPTAVARLSTALHELPATCVTRGQTNC